MAERPLIIVNDFGHVNGGTAQVAIGDAIALAQAGRGVTFFCAVGPVAPELEAAGVRVVCLGQQEIAADPNRLRATGQGIWNGVAGRALDRLLAQFPVAPIVHIHGWSKALSGSVTAAALARKAPVIVSLHDYFAACPNGGFYQYPQQRICDLTAMSPACIACNCDPRSYPQKLYRVARQAVQSKMGRLPDGVRDFIVHSRLVQQILAPYLPRTARLHAVPMAIAAEYAPPAPVSENQDFLMASRLSPEKGPLLFAEAAGRAGVRAVFVGEGPQRGALPDGAQITGWLSHAGVIARLRQARALVFPSLLYETFGLTVAEALSQGVPAIVADRSAAAELIEDGVTGLLFRTGDCASLASRLEILKDSGRAAEMGRRAHERYWQAPMNMANHLAAMMKVYATMEQSQGR